MKISKTLSFFILLLYGHLSFAQEAQGLNWWDPAGHEFCVIDNQGWPADELSHYDRLPQKVEEKVRKAVWNLSRHSAGLKVRFRSNSKKILVRYQVNGNTAMPHMP